MKTKPLFAGLGLAALFFAILLPPEAYPDGKLAVILCSTFAFLITLVEGRVRPSYVLGGLLTFAFLLLHSLLLSVDAYRSMEFTTIVWAYYCLLGFFLYAGFEPFKPVAISIVVLCAIVSGYGLYQYFWGFDQIYNYAFNAASEEVVKTPAMDIIATRRVFSTLALPGTLWGFLVLALPFHAALWTQWKTQWYARAALIVSATMLLAAGFLTRSFGFLVGLFTLGAAWVFLRHRRLVWNRLTATLLIFAVLLTLAGGYFYSARSGVIEGANPISLRLKNWISAWSIFAANPMGTGLNTYGAVYPRYMLPAANETQYAHNTPLQLLSELGFPILIGAAGLLLLAQRARSRGEYRSLSPWLLLALSVWLVHNLIDINVYFPSVGIVGTVLLGLLLRKPETGLQPPPVPVLAVMIVASAGVVVFSALAMVSTELQFRAQAEFQENKFQVAAETLEIATMLMPINSSLFHDSGDVNLNLYQRRDDPKYLETATESFRRSIALSPEKAGSYTGLSLCLASANQVDGALEEIRTAQRLYPDSSNIHAIAKLLEQRRVGIPIKQR